jgi:hypothetical protein
MIWKEAWHTHTHTHISIYTYIDICIYEKSYKKKWIKLNKRNKFNTIWKFFPSYAMQSIHETLLLSGYHLSHCVSQFHRQFRWLVTQLSLSCITVIVVKFAAHMILTADRK